MIQILRMVAGLGLLLIGIAFLIEGGSSRVARFGVPAHGDWKLIALGLLMAVAGGFLVRPGLRKGSGG